MHSRRNAPLVRALAGHSAMGALLGALLALSLIATGPGVFGLIANTAAPRLTSIILIGAFAAIFAVGATLTGWIFLAIERG